MNSVIFRTGSHIVTGIMLIFSLYLLLRGHNSPGGGFIAGLIAVMAFALLILSESPEYVRQRLVIPPPILAGIGVLALVISAGFFVNYMEGVEESRKRKQADDKLMEFYKDEFGSEDDDWWGEQDI